VDFNQTEITESPFLPELFRGFYFVEKRSSQFENKTTPSCAGFEAEGRAKIM
jgi:hypothetical protein